MTGTDEALEWLFGATGIAPGDMDLARMRGSTSSSLFLARSRRESAGPRFVLRLLDNREWLAEEPDLAMHEMAALEQAQVAGLRAPWPIACTADPSTFGHPVVLMSFVEGEVDLRPADPLQWLEALARQLAAIHRHGADGFAWHYRSWVNKEALSPPDWTSVPDLWHEAIALSLAGEPPFNPVFIHRDYHPTNVLWRDRSVSGVVDWINACRGPAGVDVAHCRTNLARMYGPEAAEQFLKFYRAAAPEYRHETYWDLDSILDISGSDMGFYPPWLEFGLERIPDDLLASRVDRHLTNVMARV